MKNTLKSENPAGHYFASHATVLESAMEKSDDQRIGDDGAESYKNVAHSRSAVPGASRKKSNPRLFIL
ncbi:MAG: hypothetical protein EOO88_08465 [Pedobacter sp.]|nr:MAG: hypothetical protein EOO88_08465 [Pedobacter sp.]